MNTSCRGAGAGLVALLFALEASAQALGPRIDSLFSQWNSPTSPGCIVGVRKGAETIHAKAYGMANLEYQVPLNTETISESGSVAKQFTAAAIALLAIRGKLSLDDDIRKYVSEVPDFGTPITIGQLAHHVSGIRDQWALLSLAGRPPGSAVHTIPEILNLVSRQRMLNFPPGSEYLYSNTGYVLLGVIVKRASGKSLAEFTTEEFFGPLGMSHTQWRDDYRRIVPNRATAYAREGAAYVQDMPFTMVHGNGGLLSTVGDMLIWHDALTSGRIAGGSELVRMLETPGKLNDGTSIGYGLGLAVAEYHGVQEIGHGGATAGYRTQTTRYPDQQLSIVILCNAAEANPARQGRQIADLLLPAGPAPSPISATTSQAGFAKLAGTYRDTLRDDVLRITASDSGLMVGPGRLVPVSARRFEASFGGALEFDLDGDAVRSVTRVDPTGFRAVLLPNQAWAPSSTDLDAFAGTYRSAELNVEYVLRAGAGKLELLLAWDQPRPLTPLYPNGFREPGGRSFRFMRDGSGRVIGLRVYAGRARDVRFERVP